MTIASRDAPEALHTIVADELQAISRARGRGNLNGTPDDTGGGGAVPTGAALPLYGMPLAALGKDSLKNGPEAAMTSAQQLGWRFLVSDARGSKLVDLIDEAGGDPVAVTIKGPLVERFANAGARAESDQPDGHYDARVLDFGRLGMSELWLHCPDRADIFYSLSDPEPVRRDAAAVLEKAAARALRQGKSAGRRDAPTLDGKPDDRGG